MASSYAIDPNVFYWMNVLGSLQTMFAIFGGGLTLIGLGFGLAWIIAKVSDEDNDCLRLLRKITLWTVIPGFILICAAVFIPGKTSSMEMLIAKTVTSDNVDWTVQQIKDVVNYIVTAMEGAK